MQTTILSDKSVSTENKILGKKIMSNDKEDTPNAIDDETIK